MGTEITLEVGGITLDWSKNSRGADHGMLFQEKDRKRVRSDQINYDYFRDQDEDPGAMEMALFRPLNQILPRIQLLGFTLDYVKAEYDESADLSRENQRAIAERDGTPESELMTFEEFCTFATAHSITELDDTFVSGSDTESEERIKGRFRDESITCRVPHYSPYRSNSYSERTYFGNLIGILQPYALLRVLALNEANLSANVVWQYGPLVEAGWASEKEFVSGARRTQTFLIATEGSSDAHILKHAISLLEPDVADFFRFIDVSDRHPFPGTGNLTKFAEGLAKIDVHNQVVFVFDNDAEGYDAYQRVLSLNLPPNMRAMLLPELPELRTFPAEGPSGTSDADINRRAAAIECYLDLEVVGSPPATVVWTNYKQELGVYQGSLKQKESYMKRFMQQTTASVSGGSYDVSKLRVVLHALIGECCLISAGGLRSIAAEEISGLAYTRDF